MVGDAHRFWPREAPIVSATKGIENDSLMLMGEVVLDVAMRAGDPERAALIGRLIPGWAGMPLLTILLIGGLAVWAWVVLRHVRQH